MESTAWSVESREALAAVAASVAALAALTGPGQDLSDPSGIDPSRDADPRRDDPLRDLADACLDGLAEVARLEARTAAVKVRLAAEYVRAATALAPPAASPQEHTAREMAVVAEVACVLTVSERSAGALLSDCQTLTTALPLTLAALQAGTISWQHARIMVDETAGLDPPGRLRWRRTSWTPTHPTPPAGARPGSWCRAGSAPRHAPGGNATTRSASRNATPSVPRTGGWSSSRTGTAWPGSTRTFRPIPRRGSGNGPPPQPAPCRARTRPGP